MAQQAYAPRVVRTTHKPDGTSVFVPDVYAQPFHPFGPEKGGFNVIDVRSSVPVNNTDAIPSFSNTLPRCPPKGANFAISQINPGSQSPMHRTLSLDYGFILSGEIVLVLDGGEEKTLKAGEIIVQQGVNHSWVNRGDEPCRIVFVMLGAEKIVLEDGRTLEEDVFKKETKK
ncbi:Fc.00g040230.m01.CDS01 [Cosmosporella sp. VM-42]